MRCISVFDEYCYNFWCFLKEILKSFVLYWNQILTCVILLNILESYILLDRENECSYCTALCMGLVSSKTNENYWKQLVDSIKLFPHHCADIFENRFSYVPDFEICIRDSVYQFYYVVLEDASNLIKLYIFIGFTIFLDLLHICVD